MKTLGAVLLILAAAAGPALAEQWGSIVPGQSTQQEIRLRYGAPSRTATTKTEGQDTAQWAYEGNRAPAGVQRLIIDFGLVVSGAFRAELVRSFILEPKPGAFTRRTVEAGWGKPDGVGKDGEWNFSFYREGLFVYYDGKNDRVVSLTFTLPHAPPATPATPR